MVAREGATTTLASVVTNASSAAKSSGEGSKMPSSVMGTTISAAVLVGVKVRRSMTVE